MEKLLLVKGIEGLGNRILCMLTASLYAQLTGRKLVVDWRDECYASGGTNAFDHFFLSHLCWPVSKVPETDSVAPEIWRGHLNEPAWLLRERHGKLNDANGWRAFSVDLGRLDYSQHVAVMWTYKDELNPLRPHLHAAGKPLSSESRFAVLRSLLHQNFILHPQIREAVDRFKEHNFTKRTIGVHIRYSDYRTALWPTLKAVYELIDFDPTCRIFVCTDNIQIKRLFERQFRNVVSTSHWFPSTPGLPLHYDMNRPNPLLTGIECLVDLYLISECDELIVDTSSSFAYVATLLTNSPVYDKKRRDKLSPRIRHISTALLNRLRFQSWAPDVTAKLVRQQRRLERRFLANRRIHPPVRR